MKKVIGALVGVGMVCAGNAQAWNVTAKVVTIEPSYIPDKVLFKVDQDAGTCSAGNWLWYHGDHYGHDQHKNVQAMYAGLLTAMITERSVAVHGVDSCVPINVHSLR